MATKIKAGRRIGSKVKLNAFYRKLHPSIGSEIGTIKSKEILTPGHGIMRGSSSTYQVSYHIYFPSHKRTYFIGASGIVSA